MIFIYTDGASRGNGGESAAAYIIFKDGKEIHRSVRSIGLTTNNMAEYMAVHDAVEYCYLNFIDEHEEYTIVSDSMLVIKQLCGKWRITKENLREINRNIKFYIDHMGVPFNYEWKPREYPILRQCDKMNNECLDNLMYKNN